MQFQKDFFLGGSTAAGMRLAYHPFSRASMMMSFPKDEVVKNKDIVQGMRAISREQPSALFRGAPGAAAYAGILYGSTLATHNAASCSSWLVPSPWSTSGESFGLNVAAGAVGGMAASVVAIAQWNLRARSWKSYPQLLPSLAGLLATQYVVAYGLWLGCFYQFQEMLNPFVGDVGIRGWASTFAMAHSANIIGTTVTRPLQILFVRGLVPTTTTHPYVSVFTTARTMLEKEGVSSFFKTKGGNGVLGGYFHVSCALVLYDRIKWMRNGGVVMDDGMEGLVHGQQ